MIGHWIEEIEEEVLTCLCGAETMSPRDLAARLGMSESAAVSYICLLVSDGRLTIERVSAPRRAGAGRDEDHAVPAPDRVERPDRRLGGPDSGDLAA